MKKLVLLLPALAGWSALLPCSTHAVSLDDIQFWCGSGTNRAALVIHWNSPEVRNNTAVPDPVAEKSLAWGYRFNGTATAEDMFNAVVAADHRLFVTSTEPSPGFGAFVYSIGYDLNNNGVIGLRIGTNIFANNAFTNGQRIFTSEDPDNAEPLDAGDLLWSGSFGPNWEMWREHGGAGGFTNSPDRGSDPYWTATETDFFSDGFHGQWDYASAGLQGTSIHDGSWIAYTISAGGLNFFDPNDPGTLAYDFHKHAPIAPEPASTNAPFAAQIVSAQGPFGNVPYEDPASVLGAPTTRFYESAAKPATRVKVIEAIHSYSVENGATNKLLLTMNTGSSVIARFDHPITDNPANPYGLDFQVFGNTFFTGNGFVGDAANLNTITLGGAYFSEPMKISVSPGFTGQPGENPNDPATWPWYRFNSGPYGDSLFPSQAYQWNRADAVWSDERMDCTKPVNPVLQSRFAGITAADAVDLYTGSGGGAGFDLKESGFNAVQYVKIEGLSGFSGGEIDAVSIVRPMTLGDTLSIAPENLTNATAQLFFQKPGAENQNVIALNFTAISDIAQVTAERLTDAAARAALPGTALNTIQATLSPLLGTTPVTFEADIRLAADANYIGDGNDLRVLQWNGTNWNALAFTYDSANHAAVIAGATNLSTFALAQFTAPNLAMEKLETGFAFRFTPVANCTQTLERSVDLIHWDPVKTITPTGPEPVTLEDSEAPSDKAFYRIRLTLP